MSIAQRVIAVVDDDPAMLQAIERLLRAYGFDAALFASAESFLRCDSVHVVACLVLDIHLGDMSSIELRRRLTACGCQLPTIFVTAVDDEALYCQAMDAGCVAYLRKPFQGTSLISAIDQAIT